jgi:hypothetical protein
MYRSWVRSDTPSADLFRWIAHMRISFDAVWERSPNTRKMFMVTAVQRLN